MKPSGYARQLVAVLAVALTLAWVVGLSQIVIPYALEAGVPETRSGERQASTSTPRNPLEASSEDGSELPDGRSHAEGDPPRYSIAPVEDREEELPGKRQLQALAEAYPDRIEEIAAREDQWAARIDGAWYYFAEGRMLPRELREDYNEFTGVRLYRYRTGPAELPEIDDERAEQLRRRTREREADPPVRHNGFLDALYGVSSARDADQKMERIRFLGLSTRVHPIVVEPLERVEAEIREAMEVDAGVRRFVESLGSAGGYAWREIAGTASRSYHSYGIAIDLIPRSYQGNFGYWRWAMQAGVEDWWDVPFERRWGVPQPVVDAFERQEFIWGGKWLFFDPIHFEYRPELFILSGYRE